MAAGSGQRSPTLTAAGWTTVGVDLSAAALRGAARSYPAARFAQADVLGLPLRDASADLLLDRGCFHYLAAADRDRYAREARRVLRPGGRFLLRACRSAAGVPNDIDDTVIERAFHDWHLAHVTVQDIASETRYMPALVVRLNAPS